MSKVSPLLMHSIVDDQLTPWIGWYFRFCNLMLSNLVPVVVARASASTFSSAAVKVPIAVLRISSVTSCRVKPIALRSLLVVGSVQSGKDVRRTDRATQY